MAWIQVQQRKVWGRPAGKVRVGVNDVRGTRLVNIIMADDVLKAAGIAIKDALVLERGEGEHAGWLRVTRGTGETRIVGKLPQTRSGIVRFTLPPELPLAVSRSTTTEEWETGKGWVALRIPPAVLEGRAPPKAAQPAAQQAAAAKLATKTATMEPPSKEERALSMLRGRVGTDQVCRETGLSPREVVRLADQVRAERAQGKAA